MKISISYTNDKPMYEQIKDNIRQSIVNGELKNNDLLPSVRQLAKDLNVSMITTKRAYSDLEAEGFIYTVSGRGTFVRPDIRSDAQSAHAKKLLQEFSEKTRELRKFSIKKETAIKAVEIVYAEDIGNE